MNCRDENAYNYNNVRRWTTRLRLDRWGQPSDSVLDCDKIIIPVHLGCHWTCAVINLKEQQILYFDSLGVHAQLCHLLFAVPLFIYQSGVPAASKQPQYTHCFVMVLGCMCDGQQPLYTKQQNQLQIWD